MTSANPSHLTFVAQSDLGLKRKNNEDSILALPDYKVFVVADGMGGADAGEVASARVVRSVEAALRGTSGSAAATFAQKGRIVSQALKEASDWIWRYAREQNLRSCGTTVVALVFDSRRRDSALVLHAGDSRAYRFRSGRIEQLTRDHSFAEASGVADVKRLPARLQGVITRAVGIEQKVAVEETPVNVAVGDIFMLCSDGLSSMLSKSQLQAVFREKGNGSPAKIAEGLIAEANRRGGHDNISVVLVRIEPESICGENTPASVGTDASQTAFTTDGVSTNTETGQVRTTSGHVSMKSDSLFGPSEGSQAIGFSAVVRLGLGVIALLLLVLALLTAADRKLASLAANRQAIQKVESGAKFQAAEKHQGALIPAIVGEAPEPSGEGSQPFSDDSESIPVVPADESGNGKPLPPDQPQSFEHGGNAGKVIGE